MFLVTLMEMAFSGNCGFNIHLSEKWKTQLNDSRSERVQAYFPLLFGEESGFLLEVLHTDVEQVNVSDNNFSSGDDDDDDDDEDDDDYIQ